MKRASKPKVSLIPPATQASRVTHVINDRFSLVLFLKKNKNPPRAGFTTFVLSAV